MAITSTISAAGGYDPKNYTVVSNTTAFTSAGGTSNYSDFLVVTGQGYIDTIFVAPQVASAYTLIISVDGSTAFKHTTSGASTGYLNGVMRGQLPNDTITYNYGYASVKSAVNMYSYGGSFPSTYNSTSGVGSVITLGEMYPFRTSFSVGVGSNGYSAGFHAIVKYLVK